MNRNARSKDSLKPDKGSIKEGRRENQNNALS